jgi:hypothetical protein
MEKHNNIFLVGAFVHTNPSICYVVLNQLRRFDLRGACENMEKVKANGKTDGWHQRPGMMLVIRSPDLAVFSTMPFLQPGVGFHAQVEASPRSKAMPAGCVPEES